MVGCVKWEGAAEIYGDTSFFYNNGDRDQCQFIVTTGAKKDEMFFLDALASLESTVVGQSVSQW